MLAAVSPDRNHIARADHAERRQENGISQDGEADQAKQGERLHQHVLELRGEACREPQQASHYEGSRHNAGQLLPRYRVKRKAKSRNRTTDEGHRVAPSCEGDSCGNTAWAEEMIE